MPSAKSTRYRGGYGENSLVGAHQSTRQFTLGRAQQGRTLRQVRTIGDHFVDGSTSTQQAARNLLPASPSLPTRVSLFTQRDDGLVNPQYLELWPLEEALVLGHRRVIARDESGKTLTLETWKVVPHVDDAFLASRGHDYFEPSASGDHYVRLRLRSGPRTGTAALYLSQRAITLDGSPRGRLSEEDIAAFNKWMAVQAAQRQMQFNTTRITRPGLERLMQRELLGETEISDHDGAYYVYGDPHPRLEFPHVVPEGHRARVVTTVPPGPKQFASIIPFIDPETRPVTIPGNQQWDPWQDPFTVDPIPVVSAHGYLYQARGFRTITDTDGRQVMTGDGNITVVNDLSTMKSPWAPMIHRESDRLVNQTAPIPTTVFNTHIMVPLIPDFSLRLMEAGLANLPIDVPTVPLFAQVYGPSDPSMIRAGLGWTPGLMENHLSYESWRLDLAARGIATYMVDFRGSGYSADADPMGDLSTYIGDFGAALTHGPGLIEQATGFPYPMGVGAFSSGAFVMEVASHQPAIARQLAQHQVLIPVAVGAYQMHPRARATYEEVIGKGMKIATTLMGDNGKMAQTTLDRKMRQYPGQRDGFLVELGTSARRATNVRIRSLHHNGTGVRAGFQNMWRSQHGEQGSERERVLRRYRGFGHQADPLSNTPALAQLFGSERYETLGPTTRPNNVTPAALHSIHRTSLGEAALISRLDEAFPKITVGRQEETGRNIFRAANGSWLTASYSLEIGGQGVLQIIDMAVPPALRQRGHGTALVMAALRHGQQKMGQPIVEIRGVLDKVNGKVATQHGELATPAARIRQNLGFSEITTWPQLIGRRPQPT